MLIGWCVVCLFENGEMGGGMEREIGREREDVNEMSRREW